MAPIITALLASVMGCGSSPPTSDMVSVPAGTYLVGRSDGPANEGPSHYVRLEAFELDRFEVTNRQFRTFVSAEDCPGPRIEGNPDPCVYDGAVQSNTRPDYWSNSDYNDYPVVNVRWDQADAYCRWLDKRLPTEAEWEVAARGSDGRLYPWGNENPSASEDNRRCDLVNFEGCTPDSLPVADLEDGASPFGAVQLAGNIAEWTADIYNPTIYQWSLDESDSAGTEDDPLTNPTGPATGSSRVVRGGSWYCPADKVTTTFRDSANPLLQYNTIGFRCARGGADAQSTPTPTPTPTP